LISFIYNTKIKIGVLNVQRCKKETGIGIKIEVTSLILLIPDEGL